MSFAAKEIMESWKDSTYRIHAGGRKQSALPRGFADRYDGPIRTVTKKFQEIRFGDVIRIKVNR